MTTDGPAIKIAENPFFTTVNLRCSFSVSQTGVLAYQDGGPNQQLLTWYDRTGKRVADSGTASTYWAHDVSRDGNRVAVTRFDSNTNSNDIWVGDAASGAVSRLTSSPADDLFPAWSYDGKWIAYVSSTPEARRICIKDSASAQAEKVAYSTKKAIASLAWAPDGRSILFTMGEDLNKSDIELVHTEQPAAPQTWLATGFRSTLPQFSPDGHWVAYVSDETGRPEVYVRSFANPAGAKWQISSNEGSEPRWRADGKELYYVEQHKQMMAVAVKARGESFSSEKPLPLFPVQLFGADFARFEYDVTPDGQRFLIEHPKTDDDRPVRIVVNWDAPLRQSR